MIRETLHVYSSNIRINPGGRLQPVQTTRGLRTVFGRDTAKSHGLEPLTSADGAKVSEFHAVIDLSAQ